VKAAAIDNVPRYALPAGDAAHLAVRNAPTKELELYVERSTMTDLDPRSAAAEIDTYVYDRQVANEVIIAGITAVKEIVIAGCTAGPLTCFIVCSTILIAGYCKITPLHLSLPLVDDFRIQMLFILTTRTKLIPWVRTVAYKVATNDSPSYQGGTFTPTRAIEGVEFTNQEAFEPTADCGLRCQLHTKLPEGVWTHTGNATFRGHVHQIHHFINGTTIGIRAYQKNGPALSKRNPYDQEDYESVVGDYYWNYGTGASYDSFHSTTAEINAAGDDVGGYLYYNNYIAACVDFVDSTGLLDDGVIAMGWNNQPYIWSSQSALDGQISTCNIGNLYEGGIVPGPTQDDSL
jgi:hypothetical protein